MLQGQFRSIEFAPAGLQIPIPGDLGRKPLLLSCLLVNSNALLAIVGIGFYQEALVSFFDDLNFVRLSVHLITFWKH